MSLHILSAMALLAAVVAQVPEGYVEESRARRGGGATGSDVVSGTPLDGSEVVLRCADAVTAQGGAGSVTCSFPWSGLPPSWCTEGYHCFTVISPMSLPRPEFAPSLELQTAVNDRNALATIDRSQGLEEVTLRLTIFMVKFGTFVEADDLEVCFSVDTLETRCVRYVLSRPPDWIQVRVAGEEAPFAASVTTTGHAFMSTVLYVRAHDFNRKDTVVIDLMARHNGTVMSPTSNLIYPLGELAVDYDNPQIASFRWMGEAYCVDADAREGWCPSGVWERVGILKPKATPLTYNATFGATDAEGEDVMLSSARATAAVVNDVSSPTWFDDVRWPGVQIGSPLEGQFIGSPIPPPATSGSPPPASSTAALLGKRAYVGCPLAAAFFSFSPSANATNMHSVELRGESPDGLVLEHRAVTLGSGNVRKESGNGGVAGKRVVMTQLAWTPQQGQEGKLYNLCLVARLGGSTTRCINIQVERCMYCAQEGDTLSSIAQRFHTTWLQLWTANDNRHLTVTPGSVVTLGPLYTVKPLDSLDSLATRFHTEVTRLLLLNPDIEDPAHLQVGQQLCFLPDICPV